MEHDIMNMPIIFTPNQMITMILAVSAFIASLGGAVGIIAKLITKIKSPEAKQNKRIEVCEQRLDGHDELFEKHKKYFTNDDERLKRIEESNRVTQRGMLALLKHSINGDDVSSLKSAEKDLENYLINKEQ